MLTEYFFHIKQSKPIFKFHISFYDCLYSFLDSMNLYAFYTFNRLAGRVEYILRITDAIKQ